MMHRAAYTLAALGVGWALTGQAQAGAETPANYQVSESVSGTVYRSQQQISDAGVSTGKNTAVESVSVPATVSVPAKATSAPVKQPNGTAELAPVVTSVSTSVKAVAPVAQTSATSPASKPMIQSLAQPRSPKAPEAESLLSFIDSWLGIQPVKPWQKGTLAKKEMKPGGVVPEFDVFSEKVFSYKQGSVGGNGVGGGGCGCN
ncbi:DUF4266 domain-containing protein [Photobacterium sp. TY1-4]|uniref:DUF4266 domain-containing protein n=1 Tax=Photobacterium sp. TY1-4 TaxID=2899122 RepID=UPI0021BFAF49|nr:DUF4266 domain-containing protein [Photobacterium sp. TY1-4]UXI03635.1 DUF4266 domain-containing protein [Photobacterium sp. TY1-4]